MIGRGLSAAGNYGAVGFDMDHTLIRYRLRHFIKLIYQSTALYLALHRGYPQWIFPDNDEEANHTYRFFFRAVYDHLSGNLLKMGSDGLIMRGFHGFRQLPAVEIVDAYGPRPALPGHHILASRDAAFTNLHEFYGASVVPLIARIVQVKAEGRCPLLASKSFAQIMEDIAAAFVFNHRLGAEGFDAERLPGYFFSRFLAHPRHYIHGAGPALLDCLRELRQRGKLVFVVSNSYFCVAERLLLEAFGPDWADYFDFLVFSADKPGFFEPQHAARPFADLAGNVVEDFGAWLQRPRVGREKVLLGGHADALSRHFAGAPTLFFGDTIVSDCVHAFGARGGWDCAFVLEELSEIENGLCASEYYEVWKNWGSALRDKSPLGGVDDTLVFHFASSVAHRTFSRVEAPECLELLRGPLL